MKKGFTLIELLAVIVIIGIISVIAIPQVLKIIEYSKEQSFRESVRNIYNNIETEVASHGTTSGSILDLNMSNVEKFLGGSWEYNDTTKKITLINITDGIRLVESVDSDTIKTSFTVLNMNTDATPIAAKFSDGYVKGLPTNNYIWYSGMLWRVVVKDDFNNDNKKELKLVTDDTITNIAWGPGTGTTYVNSYVYKWLNNPTTGVFYNSLHAPTSFLVNAIWNTTKSAAWDSLTGTPSTSQAYIGLINNLEYFNTFNLDTQSFLQTGRYSYNMTTYYTDAGPYLYDAIIDTYGSDYEPYAVRPCVVLKSDIKYSSGKGTLADPYKLLGDSSANQGDKLNTRYAGEYIKIPFEGVSNSTWRIVSKNDNKTKLVLNGTYNEIAFNDEYKNDYSNSLLRTTLEGLDFNSNSLLTTGPFYLGKYSIYMESGNDYLDALNTDISNNYALSYGSISSKIGVPRIGEMFSGQDIRLANGNRNDNFYWMITGVKSIDVGDEYPYLSNPGGYTYYSEVDTLSAMPVRPQIWINENAIISGGSGTLQDPYTIE